ncbi:MAG TPA: POTRA domain-containing protein [Pyrinomonadaceae bacterium]|nr:POTRA domain-containing protein [Pyrinomonadaceae bacterium]
MKNATFLLAFGLVLIGASRVSAQSTSPTTSAPRLEIAEIRFEGNRLFDGSLLTAKIKQCIAGFQKDDPNLFRSDVFEYCLRDVANYERSQGFLQARFGEPKVQRDAQAVVITIESHEGILYRVGNLEIEGANQVPEAEIHKMLGMKRGDIPSGEKIAKTLFEDLRAIYGDKGFIQYTAEIAPTFRTQPGDAEGVVDFKIIVDEGQQFTLRNISFKGDNLPESAVRHLLLVREGDVYSQKSFDESIRRINETGWFNRVDRDKDVDYRTDEKEKLVDVVIKLSRRDVTLRGY